MKMLRFKVENRVKALKGNLHFGKIVLALLLIFTMVIGNLNLSMASSNTKTMTIEFEEQLEGQSRSKTVTIPNLKNIVSVKTNTGNVSISISGDKVTINVSGGSPSKSIYNPTKYSKIVTDSKTSETNSFPDSITYNSEGYSGTLNKDGAAYKSEEEYTKTVYLDVDWYYKECNGNGYHRYKRNDHLLKDPPYGAIWYSRWEYDFSRPVRRSKCSGCGYEGLESGSDVYKADATFVRVVYNQSYKGIVYKAGYDNYYKYEVTIEYIDNSDPTIKITLPIEKGYFGKEEGYNTIPLEVDVKDSDIGDTLKAYYRINGTEGQAGIQFGGNITANGTNQKLTGTIPKETVTNLSDGTHKLYMWVEDNKGGKSAEVVRNINIDKTPPNEFTPTVIANSISEITVSGETTDSGSKLKPEPYSYKLSNDDWSEWTSEKAKKYTGLKTNTRYDFTMRAIDNVGNVRVTETIQKYTLAEAPGLTIIDARDTSIIGKINPKSNPSYTEYKIEYSLDGNTWTKIDGRNEWDTPLDFAATNLLPGKKYYVRVKARNGDKLETGYSNIENIITKPQAPVLKEPVAISGSEIKLEWDKVLSALKYHVEYKESNSSSWIKLTTTENLIKIGQLNPNEQYDFRVRSKNETRLSDYSSIKNRYTKALNPKKIILKDVTDTSLTFEVVNDSRNINTPETILRLDGVGDTGWSTDKTKSFSGLEPGRTYKFSINTRNGDKEDNGWLNVPGDIPIEDEFGNPVTEITTIIPVEDFKVVNSSVNTLTVSWNAELNQEYEVYLKDESGNEVPNTRSGWFSGGTYTFTNLPSPNTRYVPYIITRRVRSATHLAERKVLNDEKAYTNAEGISRGVFESGEDYITIKLNVENTRNPNDTEYVIKNDITGQEVTVTHDNPVWLNTNLAKESFYTYSVRVINKNKEPSYYTRLVFEDGDEAHTTLPDIDIEPGNIIPDNGDFINLDDLKEHDLDQPIWFNPEEDLNNNIVQLESEKYRVTRNRIEVVENHEEIEVINYSYSREGFGYTDWKPLEKGKFKEKLIFNTPGIYRTHWKFKNYNIESKPVIINYYADWIEPSIDGESAIKGQTAVTGNEFGVRINAKDNISPYLFYSIDDGKTWYLLKEGQNEIVFTNIKKSPAGVQNKLTVKVADIAGNVVQKTFTVWGIEK